MSKSNIFIISGPSGAGEDSIIAELEKMMPIERIVNTTTRPVRNGESQGNPYYFITQDEFEKKLRKGNFAEYAQHYNGNFYGVSKDELEKVSKSGKIGMWKMEYKGVITVKQQYPKIKAIFINAESLEILERRIRKRDKVSEEFIKERMEYTKEWLKHLNIYDYQVINKEGKLEEAVSEVIKIIKENI